MSIRPEDLINQTRSLTKAINCSTGLAANAPLTQAINSAKSTFDETVSVEDKKKSLLKFGTHTSVGTGWETLAEWQDSETEETFVSGNDITHVISDDAGDTGFVILEYHTLVDGNAVFGVQRVALEGLTPVPLDVPCFRANRLYRDPLEDPLAGNVAVYEGGAVTSGKPNDDDQVHLLIVAGENQTQKAATTISYQDFWFISNISLSVTEKTSSWAEGRIEIKPIEGLVWLPITQNFASSDASGTIELLKDPYIIVPKNYDVRFVVRTNTGGVSVSGGFSGYLASVK